MKWFQHDADARQDPKLKVLIAGGGAAAYGSYWMLAEFIAQRGEGEPGWGTKADGSSLDAFDMAIEAGLDGEDALGAFLDRLAALRLIDRDVWATRRVVFMPAMAKRADEYTRKKARRKSGDAGETSGAVDQMSGHNADRPVDVDVQDQNNDQDPEPVGLPMDDGPNQVDRLVAIWNTSAAPGLPRVALLTDERRRKFGAALARHPNLADWERVIKFLNTSNWWLGKSDKGRGHDNWKGNLEYLAKPGKLQEGIERADAAGGRSNHAAGTGTRSGGVDAATGRVQPRPGKYSQAGE